MPPPLPTHPAPPSPAQHTRGAHRQGEVELDGRLAQHELEGDEKHAPISADDAVARGLITETYRKDSLTCRYKFCPVVAQNKKKKKKCGVGAEGEQAGRSKCSMLCMHAKCRCGFHPTCFSIVHRLMEPL